VSGALDRGIARRRLRRRDKSGDLARLPDTSKPLGTNRLPEIEHVVLLMMENHSFDNYFGMLRHGEGLVNAPDPLPVNTKKTGAVIDPYHLATTIQLPGVPSQSWHASHIQFESGRNDGFVRSIEETVPDGDPRAPMGYWTEDDLPFYSALARTFALSDRWFCSLPGPTFPNRRFLIAGTANGLIDDVPTGMIDYPGTGTMFDLLDRHDIAWANYHHVAGRRIFLKRILGAPGLRGFRTLKLAAANFFPAALKAGRGNLQFTADLHPLGIWRCLRHLRTMDQFFEDAEAGTLPAVSIVDPDFQASSEENPQDIQVGEGFAAAVINAVMRGKGWPKTLLIWFYDEHGGYFDHVPPPGAVEPDHVRPRSLLTAGQPIRWVLQQLGFWKKLQAADSGAGSYDRLGFRVPAVVVSPYSKANYVSNTCYDHTSALKLIERIWNLPPLTARDKAALDPLDDMVDFTKGTYLNPPVLPEPAVPWQRP
jgi:phospholipase C